MDVYIGDEKRHFRLPKTLATILERLVPRFSKITTTSAYEEDWYEIYGDGTMLEETEADFGALERVEENWDMLHVSRREPVYLQQIHVDDFEAALRWARRKGERLKEKANVRIFAKMILGKLDKGAL